LQLIFKWAIQVERVGHNVTCVCVCLCVLTAIAHCSYAVLYCVPPVIVGRCGRQVSHCN